MNNTRLAIMVCTLAASLTVLTADNSASGGEPQNSVPNPKDKLPEGAVLRLGTTRFRHSDWVIAVAFTGDGEHSVSTSGSDEVRIWDAATGLETERFALKPLLRPARGKSSWWLNVRIMKHETQRNSC